MPIVEACGIARLSNAKIALSFFIGLNTRGDSRQPHV